MGIPARTPMELGLFIRERRRTLGWGQQELAERVGASRQWIVAVEGGKPRAELGLVLRTLEALGIELQLAVPSEDAVLAPGQEPSEPGEALPPIDLDAIVARARSKKP